MRTKRIIIILVLVISTLTVFAQNDVFNYFGQNPPGDSAIIFAPEIISLPSRNEQNIVFSPTGRECFFGEWATDFSYSKIYYSKRADKEWLTPVEASFSIGKFASNAFFSADGNRLYFHNANYSGSEPYDIWMIQRNLDGWSDPVRLSSPINSDFRDGCYSETKDSVIYFASNRPGGLDNKGDIWMARCFYSQPIKVENLGDNVNSIAWDWGSCIAHDGSFLIFTSERPGGIGFSDLYITFKNQEGNWTFPINMEMKGFNINLKNSSSGNATLSPDEKFLFFSRSGDIYWISTHIIDELKKEVFEIKISY